MNSFSPKTMAANDDSGVAEGTPFDNADLLAASADFNQRLQVFHLIEQLNHLCRGVQRHRGLSIALLAGSEVFAPQFKQLREQLGRRVGLITALAQSSKVFITEENLRSLHFDWDTIRDNWQDDSVLENFELHSHFVDHLHRIIQPLAAFLEPPFLETLQAIEHENKTSALARETRQGVDAMYTELLTFVCRTLPPFIELLGKTRALSVHLVSRGKGYIELEQKLSYLMSCVQREKDKITQSTQHFQQVLGTQMPSLVTVKIHEYKLKLLLDKLDAQLVGNNRAQLSSEELFQLASDVIDAYWSAVDDGLGLLQLWQRRDMERWVIGIRS